MTPPAQLRPRILDRRKVEEYEDDDAWDTYEYPPAEELVLLEGASANSIIRWVVGRYYVGSAEFEYIQLLKLSEAMRSKLRDSIEHLDPTSAAEREHNHTRYRAHVLASMRGDIREALAEGDVERAVVRAVQEILDGELRLKYLEGLRLVTATPEADC